MEAAMGESPEAEPEVAIPQLHRDQVNNMDINPPQYTERSAEDIPAHLVSGLQSPADNPPSYQESQRTHSRHVSPQNHGQKSLLVGYLLGIPFGLLGLHHFYFKRKGFGLLYLFTFGLLGFGWIIDLARMPWLVEEANARMVSNKDYRKHICDAYVLCCGPLGLLGLHQYYLNRPMRGLVFTLTFGFLGVWWVHDLFKIPSYIKCENHKLEVQHFASSIVGVKPKTMCTAVAFGVTPLGLFGGHHFYLERYDFGMLYCMTFGLLGIGWIVDWFRMTWLVLRANRLKLNRVNPNFRYLDDAYLLLFPFGFLGLHQFYLYRPLWGVLYLCSFGCLGVGWIRDFFILPLLVREANATLDNHSFETAHPEGVVERQEESLPTNSSIAVRSLEAGCDHVNHQETPILRPPTYEEAISTAGPLYLTQGPVSPGHMSTVNSQYLDRSTFDT